MLKLLIRFLSRPALCLLLTVRNPDTHRCEATVIESSAWVSYPFYLLDCFICRLLQAGISLCCVPLLGRVH
jgi:hypothetical protein